MSNETKALSISFRSDDGCIEHNNRDFFTDNVDKSRSPNNITYVKRDLRELYHELFDEALAEYNARQNRPDRQIPDYYEHIRKSKKEKLFQEIIVMFGNSEAILWGSSERAKLTEILNNHNIARQIVGAFHDHKSVEEYRRYAQILGNTREHINALKKENPVDLSSTDVGEILNQNDLLRETITKQKKEISQLRSRNSAKFLPIEIYNDEKRQYIIEQLQRVNCPFVEENSTIYVPEYYEPSVKKALAAFKTIEGQNIRERLKFFIDRILYSARNFEDFIKLLEDCKYEVRRGKYIAIKPPYAKRFFRLKSLGEDYSEYSLKNRIENKNKIPYEFKQAETQANALEKPFYAAINTNITLVRKFEITPAKWDKQRPYDFMNDKQIGRLLLCLNTLSEFEIKSREQLYRTAEKLQEEIENGDDIELKIQLSQIESTIRTYEEIVEGNYIDNLIRAERERKESLQKKSEQPKQSQTVNRKDRR